MFTPPINIPPVTIQLPQFEMTYMGHIVTWIESWEEEGLVFATAMQVSLAVICLFLNMSVIGIPVFIRGHREWLKLEQYRFYLHEFTCSRKAATQEFNTIKKAWETYYNQLSEENLRLKENLRSLLQENHLPETSNLILLKDPTIESLKQAQLPDMQFLGLKPRPYIGRFIIWIESWKNHGLIFRVTMKTLLTLGCVITNANVIGIPLFIWGNREWTQRDYYRYYNTRFSTAYKMANQEFESAKNEWMKHLREIAEQNAKLEIMIQKLGESKEEI